MSQLPEEQLSSSYAFTYSGLDVFGPWNVVGRRTKGGLAYNKRWAVLFTCLSTRAVHIEVIESMDVFINCLFFFFAIWSPWIQLHSGGAWECTIGVARRILDSMLMRTDCSHLTHEVLRTLMAEVTTIINSRPVVPVSSDADSLEILARLCSLHKRQAHHLHRGSLQRRISTSSNGSKFST